MKHAAKIEARAFAPASVANVAVGFDLMGFSAGVTGDTVHVEKIKERKVVVGTSTGLSLKLPTDPNLNTATAGLVRLIDDLDLAHGFKVSIEKGIALGSGMGGSAASAVAAIVAANALLAEPLTKNQMVSYALIGEKVASGSYHADNIAPSLFGGITLSVVRELKTPTSLPDVDIIEIPIPEDLWCVLLHPHIKVETKVARGILKPDIPFRQHLQASANLAGALAGFYSNDLSILGRYLKDIVIEPQRAHLIPGFSEIQQAATTDEDCLGCTISGAGPSIFALAEGQHAALEIQRRMSSAADPHGPSTAWAFQVKREGARLLP